MVESPLMKILEMIAILIEHAIDALVALFPVLKDFISSIGFVSSLSFGTFIISAVVLTLVILFLGKFFFHSLKSIIILLVVGLAIIYILMISGA